MNYIDRFESDEVLLITSLTLCFGWRWLLINWASPPPPALSWLE